MKSPDSPPLGPPGAGLDLLECGIWEEMRASMWWLRAHHAPVFELFVRMVARMRRGETSNEVVSGIMRCSRQLGADPTSDRIFGGLQDDEPERDEFLD
jgi:hypothetical protein